MISIFGYSAARNPRSIRAAQPTAADAVQSALDVKRRWLIASSVDQSRVEEMAAVRGNEAGRIRGFNGLRGLCIISVYLSHKCGLEFYAGAIGVWTFFVLSGFLIIGELHRQRIEIESGSYGLLAGLRVFYLKRFLRILPAYYAVIALLFLFRHFYAWVGQDLGFRYHILYLSNYWVAFAPSGSGPFGVLWSLAVEQQFYVVAPVLLLVIPSRWHLALCLSVVGALALLYLSMTLDGLNPGTIYLISPWNYATIILGGIGSLILENYDCRPVFRTPWLSCLSFLALLSFPVSWILFRDHDPQWMAQVFLATFSTAYFVCWIRIRQNSFIVQILEWPFLEHLGVISYGFYLIHNFIPNPLGRALSIYVGITVPDGVKMTIGAAFGFAVSASLAHLSWIYYEKPLLNQKGRLTRLALGQGRYRPSRQQELPPLALARDVTSDGLFLRAASGDQVSRPDRDLL